MSASSPVELFLAFSRVSLQGFGGVLPLIQHEVVERSRWLDDAGFAELLGLSAALPGPNVCNLALMLGWRQAGLAGALASLAGLILFPVVVLLMVASLVAQVAHQPWVRGMLDGMGAVAAGLILASAWRMFRALKSAVELLVLGGLAFVTVGFMHWPLIPVLLVCGGLAVARAVWILKGESPS